MRKVINSIVAALFILFAACSQGGGEKKIGLQVYSVRENIKSNIDSTFKVLSEIGYKYIELAGYNDGKFYGKSPEEFKNLVDKYGFNVVSSHCNVTTENVEQTVQDAKKIGIKYVVKPYYSKDKRDSISGYYKLAENLNEMGKVGNNYGVKIAYHNHDFELEELDGEIPYNVLLNNTNPDLVTFEMDLFWVTKAEADPVEYFEKFPGRFELWHVKDMDDSEEMKFAPVGKGTIDFDRIFAKKEKAGMKYFFVEQDRFYNYKPLESVKISYDYLNNADFITMVVAGKVMKDKIPSTNPLRK